MTEEAVPNYPTRTRRGHPPTRVHYCRRTNWQPVALAALTPAARLAEYACEHDVAELLDEVISNSRVLRDDNGGEVFLVKAIAEKCPPC